MSMGIASEGLEPTHALYFMTWTSLARVVSLFMIYFASQVAYRLYLSPLSQIPGSKIASATTLYMIYHDVVRSGRYIWKIEEMHKLYGPIIRISPDEVHVNDPEFIDHVFAGGGKRRDKGKKTINGLGASPTAIGTQKHDLHKSRRAALSPYFSTQSIRRLEPMIHKVLDQIFQRMDQHRDAETPVNMSRLFRAATHDLIADYSLGQGLICFSRSDLNQPYFDAYHDMVKAGWHFGCHFPWVAIVARKLPTSIAIFLMPGTKHFISLIQAATDIINNIKSRKSSYEETIFNGILESSLPDSEKDSSRLAEEAHVLLSAGTDSSANTLSAITYHLLSDPAKLRKLRAELQAAVPKGCLPTFSQVKSLPYLSAVIDEGLRLHPAVSSRQARVAPDEDLFYTNRTTGKTYKIPAGTCISMTAPLLSRLPDIYPFPNEFRPERFLEDARLKRYQLAFSRGSRICLGLNFAYQEIYIILASFFMRYDVRHGIEGQTSETLELFQTTRADIDIVRDQVTENVRDESLGVRVMVKGP